MASANDMTRQEPASSGHPARGVSERVSRVARHFDSDLAAALVPHGLTVPGFRTLAALRRAGDPFELTPSDLSRETQLTSGAMTHRIDRLENAGLVQRHAAPEDRRSVRVRLTSQGRQLVDRAMPADFEVAERALRSFEPEEVKSLTSLLRKLALEFERHEAQDETSH